MGTVISIFTFSAVGYILGSMGYSIDTWQFWVIILCMAITKLSALFRN